MFFQHLSQLDSNMGGFKSIDEVEFTYDCLIHSGTLIYVGDCIQYGHDPAKYNSIRKRVDSGVVREYAHRIALMKKMKTVNIPSDLEASHLCHMKACINPEHIIAEPHNINMTRLACFNESQRLNKTYCFGNHGDYPACL